MQSESVELQILLNWSDERTISTLLPLHHAFHVTHAWPNSKYEDINESIVPGGGAEQVWGGGGGRVGGGGGGAPAPPPIKPPLCRRAVSRMLAT